MQFLRLLAIGMALPPLAGVSKPGSGRGAEAPESGAGRRGTRQDCEQGGSI